jgi:hypothetical protein
LKSNYHKIINNYIQNIEVIETFISGLDDMVSFQYEKFQPENMSESLKPIFESLSLESEDIEDEKKKEIVKKIDEEFPHGSITFEYNEDKGESGVSIRIKEHLVAKRFQRTMNELVLTGRQIPMIFTSSLINLAVYFELLSTKLIQERLQANPKAMNIEQKSLTISEIEEIGSFEEAKNYLIEQEVVNLMHNGFKNWLSYFEKRMKIDLDRLKEDIEQVNEIFCRRHLFVHNDGIVSNIYLTRVDKKLREDISLGDRLSVDETYFVDALNLLKRFGLILALETWKRQEKNSEERVNFLLEYIFELMLKEEWGLVNHLCEFTLNENNIRESAKWVAKINYWLSLKKQGQFEEIKDDIERADLSALSNEFQLCRLALLDKKEEFFTLLEQVYPHAINLGDLEEWPIFNEIRCEKAYEDFINKNETQTKREPKPVEN